MSSAIVLHNAGIDPSNIGLWLPATNTTFITRETDYLITSDAPQDELDAAVAHVLAGDPPPGPRILSRADFQRRFTPQEYFDARQLAQTNATMAYSFGLFESSLEVRLDHIDTQSGVGFMRFCDVIKSDERAAEILA